MPRKCKADICITKLGFFKPNSFSLTYGFCLLQVLFQRKVLKITTCCVVKSLTYIFEVRNSLFRLKNFEVKISKFDLERPLTTTTSKAKVRI